MSDIDDKVHEYYITIINERACYDWLCESVKMYGNWDADIVGGLLPALCRRGKLRVIYEDHKYAKPLVTLLYNHYREEFSGYVGKDLLEQIDEHIANAQTYLNNVEIKLQESINMNKPFVTTQYVFGQDVSKLTNEEFIAAIKRIEGDIEKLSSIKVESKKVAKQIADLQADLALIVEAYDKA